MKTYRILVIEVDEKGGYDGEEKSCEDAQDVARRFGERWLPAEEGLLALMMKRSKDARSKYPS